MSMALQQGFTADDPARLVKPPAMEGTGFLGQAAKDVYHLGEDDLYLVGTAEVPLAAYHADEILDPTTLPLRYAGYSPSYRRGGRDARQGHPRHLPRALVRQGRDVRLLRAGGGRGRAPAAAGLGEGVHHRAGDPVPGARAGQSGDLGLSAARKYDCYGWLPTQERYREITSTSNCTEFQARRLNIRSRFAGGTGPVATLNGTLCAMTRTIIMILENHQQADGSVRVPEALRPFLGGREALTPR